MYIKNINSLQQVIIHKPKNFKYKEIYRTNIINDQPYGTDFLGYDKYAKSLANILLSEQIELPISVGIFSSWGTGKTFLLKRVEHFIKEKTKKDLTEKIVIVRFNAWEYSGADVLWAGLVKTIHDETEKKFTKCQTRFFRQFIYPFRSKTKRQIIWMCIYWFLRIIMTIISIFLISTIHQFIDELTKSVAYLSFFIVSLVSILPSVISLIINFVKSIGNETIKSAKNIEDKVGFMADVKQELEIICDFMKYKNNHKFVVFIDDLDRCPSKKIIKILDAVMLLLSNKEFPFLTFISIDPRIIISSIESSFKKQILNSGITGFEYIDKLIQIPFCIPISSPYIKKNIIQILTRDKIELLNQTTDKILQFIHLYNLYDVIKISQDDIKKINAYGIKTKIVNTIFLFLYRYFGNLDKHKFKKDKDYIHTIQEKCQFINRILLFISTKLDTIKQNTSCFCSQKKKFNQHFKNKLQDLEEIINYKKTPTYNLDTILQIKQLVTSEDNLIDNYKKKIKNDTISDEEILLYGDFLLENKSKKCILLFKEYLFSKISTVFKYSPYKHELNNLLYNLEEILDDPKNIIQSKVYKSFSYEEIDYLNSIYMFLDGNCRRNKRIINIFSISRNIMGTRIEGWYQKKLVTFKIKQKLLKLIILAEQWPYRLSWIFHNLEDYRQCKEQIIKDNQTKNKSKTLKEWISVNGNVFLLDIYKNIQIKLLYHSHLENFISMDYDPDIFMEFMNTKPNITIDDFYLLIPYLFNINLYIKNKISQISDKSRLQLLYKRKI